MEEKKIRKIGGQRENSLCAGGNVACGEQRLEGAARKLHAQGSGSVSLHVCLDLEDVSGLIPRQQLCASGAESEHSWKRFASLFYPYVNQR